MSTTTDDRSTLPSDEPDTPPLPAHPRQTPQAEPLIGTIRTRAYHKWEDAGRPDGDGYEFWLAAEREVNQQAGEPGTAADRTGG